MTIKTAFRVVACVLILGVLNASAATWTISGAYTSTNGAFLYLVGATINTNGAWADMGLGADNRWTGVEPVKVKLLVTGNGFDGDGSVVTARTRLLCAPSKYPGLYPATNVFETGDGTTTTLQLSLSDFIFAGETITVDVLAGLYTESAKANLAVTAMTVTNNSIVYYTNARPDFTWLTPQYERATGATFRVEFLACSWSAIYDNSGRPLRAARVVASDQNSHSWTSILTTCYFDYNRLGKGRARWVVDVPTAGFNDTNMISVNVLTWPYFGTNAVIDTSDGVYATPSPNYCPLQFLNDPSDTYGIAFANVSTNSGNDATGIVTNRANWTTNLQPFFTIMGAAHEATNYYKKFYGRTDCGGLQINFEQGGYPMCGTNLTAGTIPRTYVELRPYPGLTRTQCYLYTNLLGTDISGKIKVRGMALQGAPVGTAQIFNVVNCLETIDCEINTGQSAAFNIVTNWAIIDCDIYQIAQGIKTFSSATGGPSMVKDCNFLMTNNTTTLTPVLFGCIKTNISTGNLQLVNAGSAVRPRPSTMWMYCDFRGLSNNGVNSITIQRDNPQSDYIGTTLACIIIEETSTNSSNTIDIPSPGVSTNMPNIKVFDCTFLGMKVNWLYDWTSGTFPSFYTPSWVFGNIIDDPNIKGDSFTTNDGARYGNRPQMYNVGFGHNMFLETWLVGAAGDFQQGKAIGWYGLNSYGTGLTTTNTYPKFVRRGSFVIPANGVGIGNGDYHYQTASPAFDYWGPRIMSHKFDGVTSATDGPGCFTGGNTRRALN